MDGELEQLGERIAEQAAHFDAAMHRLLADLREFDERGGWHVQGAMSCAHWLAWRVGWDLVTARERVRVACKLGDFPAIDDALRSGEVSYSKVRALLRVATPANESLLLDHARLMTASQLEKLCRKYALVQRHGQDPHPLDDEQRRCVRRRDTDDGMVKIEAVLHPEEAELVWTMLNHAATQITRDCAPPASDDSEESRVAEQAPGVAVTLPLRDAAACGCDDSAESWEVAQAARLVVTPLLPDAAACGCDASAESRVAAHAATNGIDSSTGAPAIRSASTHPNDQMSAATEAAGSPGEGETCNSSDSAESREVIEPTSERGLSVLHQRADAARRAFNRADALVSLAQGYLRGDRPNRSPIEITLTIPASSLRTDVADPTEVGEMGESFISTEAARRLSCDAGVIEVIEDEQGVPLSVGRKRRTIAGALKRALHKRDTACTFPGCTNRLFLEGHHIRHWADGGETSLMNTSLLCSLHHRYVHEYGYSIELGLDQRPRFRDPHGRLVAVVPARPAVAELGWPQIRAMNAPLAVDAGTIAGPWDGTPVDYGRIVGHLVVADRLK
jgi:hypothetical protein